MHFTSQDIILLVCETKGKDHNQVWWTGLHICI